jgi:beta-phosphoglucomutase-like phosphatase (HAD superfamily)
LREHESLCPEAFTPDQKRRNFAYYERITVRDSSLSAATQAVLAAETGHLELAYEYLHETALIDLADLAHNTSHGIHLASLAGAWSAIVEGFGGMRDLGGNHLAFAPRLPGSLTRISFRVRWRVRWRGRRLRVQITPGHAEYLLVEGDDLDVSHHGEPLTLTVETPVSMPIPVPEPVEPVSQPAGREPLVRRLRLAGGFLGAIFDVDGVLVNSPHERAWRDSLRELMEGAWSGIAGETTWSADGFTSQLYQEQISGKPRMDGAVAALSHFGVPDLSASAEEYAERKQAMVLSLIKAGDFEAFPDALRFALAVKSARIQLAAASSSKNAGLMLGSIRLDTFADQTDLHSDEVRPGLTLLELFDVDISGKHFEHGKPAPDIFLAAAGELRVAPESCFVVEDASSGVRAAKAGGIAALGLARLDDADLLAAENADLVVTSLDEISIGELADGQLRRI